MNDEALDERLGQLADGELAGDEANDTLLEVLDDAARRRRLKDLLKLRQSLGAWRRQSPQAPPAALASGRPRRMLDGLGLRLGGLAAAALVGGFLVLAGVWASGFLRGRGPTSAAVTPEQMQQVAKVFALHESVAGPLAWYAADDETIRVASGQGAEVACPPIAVRLKLGPGGPGTAARTLVIVCRQDRPAAISLPAEAPGRAALRLYLVPQTVNGSVQMRYAIAVEGREDQPAVASLAGERRLGLSETPLGQLALGETLLSVGAAAWPVTGEQN